MVNDTYLQNIVPPTAYFDELTPNINITAVDGNTHKFLLPNFKKFGKKFQYILIETQLLFILMPSKERTETHLLLPCPSL